MCKNKFEYLLITPAKNEEDNLPLIIDSVVNQIIMPIAWFIVDDGSKDKTCQIIKNASCKYKWIHYLGLEHSCDYNLDEHYSEVCRKGFCAAIDFAEKNNILYKFIALSDADTVYPKEYFFNLISFLNKNRNYGIISGNLLTKDRNGRIHRENTLLSDEKGPYGTGRIWRKEAFHDTNGYILTKSPDSISNISAILNGWKIGQLDVKFYQLRETSGKYDLWKGNFSRGVRYYYIGANPLNAFNMIFYMMFLDKSENRIKKCISFLLGYSSSYINRDKRLENEEIRRYVGSYNRIFKNYLIFTKRIIKSCLK